MKTYQKVYSLVKKIPKGKVSTYGQIGQMLGLNPRVVGWALNKLVVRRPSSVYRKKQTRYGRRNTNDVIPWQRVINSKGGISTNKLINIPLGLQKVLLKREGVKFNKNEKIDLRKYLFKF